MGYRLHEALRRVLWRHVRSGSQIQKHSGRDVLSEAASNQQATGGPAVQRVSRPVGAGPRAHHTQTASCMSHTLC
eukprot:4162152-Pyramimonas_sp.AAC.1